MREHSRCVAFVLASSFLVACNSPGQSSSGTPPGACTPVAHVMARSLSGSGIVARHIPAAVANYSDQGVLSQARQLAVTVALGLNNEAELDQKIAEIYQPGHPSFHHFIGPDEFKTRYAPTQDQIDQARSFLESHGIQTVSVNANGYLIRALGSAQSLNEAFQTEIHQYTNASGQIYFAPSIEPKMPDGLSIRAVHGLNNIAHVQSHARLFNGAQSPNFGSGTGGGLSPSDIHGVYNTPSAVDGAGQTVGLFELDGYNPADIAAFEAQFGLPSVSLQNVLVDGATGAAGPGASEVTLDLELLIGMAPGVSKVIVYEAPNDLQSILDLYSRIANDNAAQIISTSWGAPEDQQSPSFLETENAIFKQMAVQGQSFFAASADKGAYDDMATVSVDDPASQPFVVAVGGTRISSSGGTYLSETTWNNGSPSAGAGGGGVSKVWAQPSWQNGISSSQNGVSSSMRNIPDVSLNADPNSGYSIFYQGHWQIYGGTSAAAPLWAGFMALVNQQRAANGLSALGFPDPSLYSIGKSSRFSLDFYDISDGSTNLFYRAVSGYDDATGLGSFNGQNLFDDLSRDQTVALNQLSC